MLQGQLTSPKVDKLGCRDWEIPSADINNKESSMEQQTGTGEDIFEPSDI